MTRVDHFFAIVIYHYLTFIWLWLKWSIIKGPPWSTCDYLGIILIGNFKWRCQQGPKWRENPPPPSSAKLADVGGTVKALTRPQTRCGTISGDVGSCEAWSERPWSLKKVLSEVLLCQCCPRCWPWPQFNYTSWLSHCLLECRLCIVLALCPTWIALGSRTQVLCPALAFQAPLCSSDTSHRGSGIVAKENLYVFNMVLLYHTNDNQKHQFLTWSIFLQCLSSSCY